jgi:hypothetical protein
MSKAEQIDGLKQLVASLEQFSLHCLKIADKTGRKTPFVWNESQKYVHARIEEQRKATGKVRAIILKGRQQGMSTYVAARFYHRVTTQFGQRALIVGHEQKSTDSLFSMVRRYHENNLFPVSTSNTNAKELIFDKLEGGYKLATAGTQDVGRGNTSQVAHLSEFAFWANAQMHMAGLGNTIADMAGTEIIIESTANGIGNGYHQMWQQAEAGRSEFIAIFVPWFWQPEYRAPVRDYKEFSESDIEYQQTYELDTEQMQWRENKIATYGAGYEWLFDQEYPAAPALAFRTATQEPLVSPNLVMAAVNNIHFSEKQGALLIGCDPAGEGDDRTAIVFRQGRTVFRVEYHSKLDTMQVAGKLAQYYKEHQPDGIFVDKVGLGAGVYDRLRELQIPVIGVGAGNKANNTERYENKRAEMWFEMQKWFADAPVRIPNDAGLISDLSSLQVASVSSGRCALESKNNLRKRGIRSPDGADALALTFAEPVASKQSLWSERTYQAPTSAGY